MFKGTSLKPFNLENELKVWETVKTLANESLILYPNSLEDDEALLKKDDSKHMFSYNKRNCILFRSGEKKILHFLIQTCDRMHALSKLSQKDAKKEVNKFKDFDGCMDYFKSVFLPLMTGS